jgi:adenylate cyclase
MSSTRQLAAIMFTDIVGYTAWMGRDEQKAFELLDKNRQIQKPIIEQFNGRWIKELGDGVMASFTTVSDAVNAAIRIQQTCNASKEFQLRIGIHLGEVVFENDDVFGDGVNIASRIQAIAEPGAIYISESIYNNVSNKQGIETKFVKQEMLKNVTESVRIYEVLIEGIQRQSSLKENTQSAAKTISEKSIAVLPFVNMSNDPDQEYFSDGLTEEIITDLSQIEELRVISRGSVMTFKGSKKKTRDIANEVGVRYVLEGSVRKSGNVLRIVAQLINADDEVHIWAEKYSGNLDDIFSIQEQVSRSIVATLKIKLSKAESEKLAFKPIKNAQAYELYQKAQYEVYRFKEEGLKRAIEYLDEALKSEGENALLYSKKGIVYCILFTLATKPETDYLERARSCASRVFDLDPGNSQGHVILGWITLYDGNCKNAVTHINRAYKANPHDPDTLLLLILGNFYLGFSEEADQAAFQMGNVDPLNPVYYALLSLCSYNKGDIDNAFKYIRKGYEIYPEIPQIQLYYAYFLTCTEQVDEANLILERYISETSGSIFQSIGLLFKCALNKTDPKNILNVEMENKLKMDVEWTWLIADFYSMMGKTADAMVWLEHAVSKGFINYPLLYQYDPFLKNIQKEKQFEKLINHVKTEWEKVNVIDRI